jgi:hypothetical protein
VAIVKGAVRKRVPKVETVYELKCQHCDFHWYFSKQREALDQRDLHEFNYPEHQMELYLELPEGQVIRLRAIIDGELTIDFNHRAFARQY